MVGVGRGSGKGKRIAVASALLVGLTAFLSLLLLSPRFGSRRAPTNAVPATMACLVSLLAALPKASAFVGTALAVGRIPNGSPTVVTRSLALGLYRAGATTTTTPALRSLTGPPALSASGADTTTATAMAARGGVKHVLVPVADGSEEIESVTIIDTLVRAGASVTVASVSDGLQVTCSRGVKITADCKLAECESRDWDAVVCPGGLPGATNLKNSEPLKAILRKQDADGRIVAAICAAPAVVLAAHGLLEGRKATCYPAPAFTEQIPDLVDEKVVVDGNIITSQGPATSMVFALQIVDSLFGAAKAEDIGKGLLFP